MASPLDINSFLSLRHTISYHNFFNNQLWYLQGQMGHNIQCCISQYIIINNCISFPLYHNRHVTIIQLYLRRFLVISSSFSIFHTSSSFSFMYLVLELSPLNSYFNASSSSLIASYIYLPILLLQLAGSSFIVGAIPSQFTPYKFTHCRDLRYDRYATSHEVDIVTPMLSASIMIRRCWSHDADEVTASVAQP